MIKPFLQQETQLSEDNSSSPGASAPWGNWVFTHRAPFLLHPSLASCSVPTCILSIEKKRKARNQRAGEAKEREMAHIISLGSVALAGTAGPGPGPLFPVPPTLAVTVTRALSVTLVSPSLASFRPFRGWHGLTQFPYPSPAFCSLE